MLCQIPQTACETQDATKHEPKSLLLGQRMYRELLPLTEDKSIHYDLLMNRESTRQAVFEYIEGYYNRKRRHSTLGYVSPEQYELQKIA